MFFVNSAYIIPCNILLNIWLQYSREYSSSTTVMNVLSFIIDSESEMDL